MRFSDIPGNSHVKERLRDMVATDRLPHALVLEGPGGLGKFALARTLAQYIHCTHRTPDGEPCGRARVAFSILHSTMSTPSSRSRS